MERLIIDGSFGEGGGQILRSSLTLSMITGKAIEIHSIRAGRKVPGLRNQHLTALEASAEICNAKITGNKVGSKRITFSPSTIESGDYSFDTGSAGSSFLVFQTIFPALMLQKSKSTVTIKGGTHNLMAPPAEFIQKTFLGTLQKLGVNSSVTIKRYGYYPKGGGEIEAHISPISRSKELSVSKLSKITKVSGEPVVIRKSKVIAEHQESELITILPEIKNISIFPPAVGPANSVSITVQREEIEQVFTGFGKRNVDPVITARVVANRAKEYIRSNFFCDTHLTDQLLIPLLLLKGGNFTCPKPTLHATTNAEIVKMFTGKKIQFQEVETGKWNCTVPKLS